MYYTIYKITNQINGKIYIGCHKTKNLEDNYMGSGKYLNRSIEKYGIENFTKEILFIYDNPKEMYAKESEIVDEDFLAEENTYNLKVGGLGGWDYLNSSGLNNSNKTKEQLKRAGLKHKLRLETDEDYFNSCSKRSSDTIKMTHKLNKLKYDNFKGKTHTDETKKKIGEKNSENQRGTKNSQYGTCWIWCEKYGNKKIKKENLKEYLNLGWFKTYKPGYKTPL